MFGIRASATAGSWVPGYGRAKHGREEGVSTKDDKVPAGIYAGLLLSPGADPSSPPLRYVITP